MNLNPKGKNKWEDPHFYTMLVQKWETTSAWTKQSWQLATGAAGGPIWRSISHPATPNRGSRARCRLARARTSLRENATLPCAKAHGKSPYAHGKAFAVCRVRRLTHGKKKVGNRKGDVAVHLCHVPFIGHTAKPLPCAKSDPRQKKN